MQALARHRRWGELDVDQGHPGASHGRCGGRCRQLEHQPRRRVPRVGAERSHPRLGAGGVVGVDPLVEQRMPAWAVIRWAPTAERGAAAPPGVGRGVPTAAMVPRVARGLDRRLGSSCDRPPVDLCAGGPRRRQRAAQRQRPRFALLDRVLHESRRAERAQAAPGRDLDHRMGRNLDEQLRSGLDGAGHRIGEPHGLAQVSAPILGAELGPVDEAAGDRRDQRHPVGTRFHEGRRSGQLVGVGRHHRPVSRDVADGEHLRHEPSGNSGVDDGDRVRLGAADQAVVGCGDAGDGDLDAQPLDQVGDLVGR